MKYVFFSELSCLITQNCVYIHRAMLLHKQISSVIKKALNFRKYIRKVSLKKNFIFSWYHILEIKCKLDQMHLACWTFTQEMTRKYRKRPELAQSTIDTRKYKLFKESITKYQKLQKSGRNYQKLQKSSSRTTRNQQQVPKRTRKYQIFPELPERASAGCNRV